MIGLVDQPTSWFKQNIALIKEDINKHSDIKWKYP